MVSLKLTPLCTIALLLFALTCASAAARPPPPASSAAPHDDAPPKSSRPLKDVEWEEESCEGGEECLMRRSAEAHLDYIYSQNLKP